MLMHNDESLALVSSKQRELATNFVSEITKYHEAGLRIDDELRQIMERKLQSAIAVGNLILEAKVVLKHRFEQMVLPFLPFQPLALRAYVKIAGKAHQTSRQDFRSRWKSVRDAAEPTGLSPISSGHGQQVTHVSNFFARSTKLLLQLLTDYRRYTRQRPLEEWNEEMTEQFSAQLRPLLDIWSQLNKRLSVLRK